MGCSAKKAPAYSRPIFALDNRDTHNILLRYQKDKIVIPAADIQARAAVCFLKDDFKTFMTSWIETNGKGN